ncbi:MAG: hypothetical protein ACE5KT_03895 [Methanosarcinales archaeon]
MCIGGHGMSPCHGPRFMGCHGFRSFMTKEEEIEMLQQYKEDLQKEIAGVERRINELMS